MTPSPFRATGMKYSGGMHLVLLLLAVFGLPQWFRHETEFVPQVITAELLPMAPITNVRPQEASSKPEEKPDQKEQAKKAVPETEQEKPKPQADEMALPDKKAEKKKEEKKKPVEDDLDKILKSVQATAKAEQADKKKAAQSSSEHAAKSDIYDESMPLSLSEKDMIRNQFIRCWNVPAGAKDAGNLIVALRVEVGQDGSVLAVKMARDEGRYGSDPFFRAAADSAMRAVHLCSPLQHLPAEKYGAWKDMELTFDPSEMAGM